MPNATRRVSVKIALDGYEEYRATVTRLNNANKLFASELGTLNEKLKANSTDTETLKRKQEVLKAAFDNQKRTVEVMAQQLARAKDAQAAYKDAVEKSEAKVKAAEDALNKYKNTSDATDDKIKELEKALDDANRELDENKGNLDAANRGVMDMETALNNANTQLYKYEAALVDNQKEQDKINGTYKEGATYVGELGTKFKDTGKDADDFKDKVSKAVDSIAKNEAFQKIKESVEAIKDALKECIDTSIKFESAFAGVAKTWSGSEEDLAAYSDTIKEMALRLPSTTTEIAKVSETAGQLGIHTKDMEKFTETMIGLGNATDITADEAAMLAAQFNAVNDFGTENIDKFASAVVWLGNNSATTESKIMAMAQRLASAGTQAGMSAQDILGVATALSSTGIAADAGGGSFSKFIANLQVGVETGKVGKIKLEEFAKVAGMTAKQFKAQWSKDPVVAIQKFVDGLASAEDEGKSSIKVLKELGLTEIRMRNALLSLASGENKLTKYVKGSNDAWEDNVALQDEVKKRYDTTESQTKILNNNIDAMKREIGDALIPVIRDAIEAAIPIVQKITEFIEKNPELIQQLAQMTAAVIAATTAVATIGTVIAAISLVGSPALLIIAGLTAGIGGLIEAMQRQANSIENYTPSLEHYGEAVVGYKDRVDDLYKSYYNQIGIFSDNQAKVDEYMGTLERLDKKKKLSKDEQKLYNDTLEKLKEIIPDLNVKIDKKTKKIQGGTEALKDQITEWKNLKQAEMEEMLMNALMQEKIDLQIEMSKLNRQKTLEQTKLDRLQKEYNEKLEREKWLYEHKSSLNQTELQELKDLHKARVELGDEILQTQKNIEDLNYTLEADVDAMIDVDKRMNSMENSMKGIDSQAKPTIDAMKEVGWTAGEMGKDMEKAGKTSEEVADDIVANFGISDDLRRKAGESMDAYTKRLREAGIDEETITQIKNYYVNNLPTSFGSQGESAGASYGDGMVKGINSKKGSVESAARSLAGRMNTVTRQVLQEKSPSRVAMEIGEYYVEGLAIGLEDEEDNLYKTAKDIATNMNNTMDHSLDSSLIFGNQGSLDLNTSGKQTVQIKQDDSTQKDLTTMVGLMERYLPAFANMQVVMNSGELVGSIAPKIDEYFANEQLAHERGM